MSLRALGELVTPQLDFAFYVLLGSRFTTHSPLHARIALAARLQHSLGLAFGVQTLFAPVRALREEYLSLREFRGAPF